MIITISGKPGAGKTTLAKKLYKKLNYEFISIGNLQGKIAQEKGITIEELMEKVKNQNWIHKEMDKKTIELGKIKNNFIIEGWIAWNFIPNSKKIFLDVDENIGAQRIFKIQYKRQDESLKQDVEDLKNKLRKRIMDSDESFFKYYGVRFLDFSNYDLIINTTNLSIENVTNKILEKLR